MNEKQFPIVNGLNVMNAHAEAVIPQNRAERLLAESHDRDVELKRMSADVQILNSQAEIELNGYDSTEYLGDGTVVTKHLPNMFERMYELRSGHKTEKEKARIKSQIGIFEQDYRESIRKLTEEDGLELCQAKLFMDHVSPKYDEKYRDIDERVKHQTELLVRSGMDRKNARKKANAMFDRVRNSLKPEMQETLDAIKGKFGKGLGIYSYSEYKSWVLAESSKKHAHTPEPEEIVDEDATGVDTPEPEEIVDEDATGVDTPEPEEIVDETSIEEKKRPSAIKRTLGMLAVKLALRENSKLTVAQVDRNHTIATFGEDPAQPRLGSVKKSYNAEKRILMREVLDGNISRQEMYDQLSKFRPELESKENLSQKTSRRKLERARVRANLANKVANRFSEN